jgi:hypothetical protein
MKDEVDDSPLMVYMTWCIVLAVGSHGNTKFRNKKASFQQYYTINIGRIKRQKQVIE